MAIRWQSDGNQIVIGWQSQVIGVEPDENALLSQSLLAGHRVVLPEPSRFVDGASVQQIGPEASATHDCSLRPDYYRIDYSLRPDYYRIAI